MILKEIKAEFKKFVELCYEEDFPQLHNELLSLEKSLKGCKDPEKYIFEMGEILNALHLYADGFPEDTRYELEEIYTECCE